MADCACDASKPTDIAQEEQRFICLAEDRNNNMIEADESDLDDAARSERASTIFTSMLVWKRSLLWPEGRRFLKVKFLGDVSRFPNTVKRITEFVEVDHTGPVMFWSQVCFINFEIVPSSEDAEIRIAMKGDKNYSTVIGVEALKISQRKATMLLGFDRDDYDDEFVYRRVLHEFGHALGFYHEHQSPQRTFEYDEAKVTEDLKAIGWSEKEIKENLFDKITVDPESMDMLNVSAFDASSIMEYDMDADWLLNYGGQGIVQKNILSATDILKASQAYSRF